LGTLRRELDKGTCARAARDRIAALVAAGNAEKDVLAAKPFADLDAKWAANEQAATSFIRMVYNSFKRS
jgi:hypothetical protein